MPCWMTVRANPGSMWSADHWPSDVLLTVDYKHGEKSEEIKAPCCLVGVCANAFKSNWNTFVHSRLYCLAWDLVEVAKVVFVLSHSDFGAFVRMIWLCRKALSKSQPAFHMKATNPLAQSLGQYHTFAVASLEDLTNTKIVHVLISKIICSVKGSGPKGAPVWLPSCVIKLWPNRLTRQTHLRDLTHISTPG